MRTHNHNESITHLAMPERRIPVLIDCEPKRAEGFVPSFLENEQSATPVRRLDPALLIAFRNAGRRIEIEKEYGAIHEADWKRLRELFALLDRVNGGDLTPIVTSNEKEAFRELPTLLDRLSPGGWLRDARNDLAGELSFLPASGDLKGRARLSVEISSVSLTPLVNRHPDDSSTSIGTDPTLIPKDEDRNLVLKTAIHGTCKTVAFAVSEAFTAGLSKTRFVVWWTDIGKKLVPGLYCPDIVTALYALAMWGYGTAGGWAICQKCNSDFARKRAQQLYCSTKCQTAAGMSRHRQKRKRSNESNIAVATKRKKPQGRND